MSESKPAAEKKTAKKPGQVVYCGPTVRGVAKQFTVYAGRIPEALEQYAQEHPAARGLIVPVERFPTVREALRKKGTAEAILFEKLMKG